jgi:hypothetical protein
VVEPVREVTGAAEPEPEHHSAPARRRGFRRGRK